MGETNRFIIILSSSLFNFAIFNIIYSRFDVLSPIFIQDTKLHQLMNPQKWTVQFSGQVWGRINPNFVVSDSIVTNSKRIVLKL
jgi:hypothetical protein